MFPPLVGLADSGDFERMLPWGALQYPPMAANDKYFGWVVGKFGFAGDPLWAVGAYPSSEAIFVKLSAWACSLWQEAYFDVRWLGALHALAFLAAAALLAAGWGKAARLSSGALLPGFLLLFCDIGYGAYFNSFYSEAASLIFMLAAVGAGLWLTAQARPTVAALVLFFGLALLLVSAKAQNMTLAAPLLLFASLLWRCRTDGPWRLALLGSSVALLGAVGLQYASNPSYMTEANKYSAVFYGILKDSPQPAEDLRALGLSPDLAVLAGTHIFMPKLPVDVHSAEFHRRFFERIDHFKILRFYVTHPGRLLAKLQVAAGRSQILRPDYLGNFEKSSGMPAGAHATRWNIWSEVKRLYVPRSLAFLAAYFGVLGVWLLRERRRTGGRFPRSTLEFLGILWLMAVAAFMTPILGDGEADIEKHLFLFNALFDLSLLLISGHLIGAAIARWTRPRRHARGAALRPPRDR
jgi:hypothetical protein